MKLLWAAIITFLFIVFAFGFFASLTAPWLLVKDEPKAKFEVRNDSIKIVVEEAK